VVEVEGVEQEGEGTEGTEGTGWGWISTVVENEVGKVAGVEVEEIGEREIKGSADKEEEAGWGSGWGSGAGGVRIGTKERKNE